MHATDRTTGLTVERLRALLRYDASSGVFIWIGSACRSLKNGTVAGVFHRSTGYVRIKIGRRIYYAHRLAWLYMTGKWPVALVDHQDGDKANNAWSNLRHAWASQNRQNVGLSRRNTSGFKGVSFCRRRGNYEANIRCAGKLKHLGRFKTPEAAHAAYRSAAETYFGPFARSA